MDPSGLWAWNDFGSIAGNRRHAEGAHDEAAMAVKAAPTYDTHTVLGSGACFIVRENVWSG